MFCVIEFLIKLLKYIEIKNLRVTHFGFSIWQKWYKYLYECVFIHMKNDEGMQTYKSGQFERSIRFKQNP